MGEVAKDGRTILFVSHNMAAITALTSKSLVLGGGKINFDGETPAALRAYNQISSSEIKKKINSWGRGQRTTIESVCLKDEKGIVTDQLQSGVTINLHIELETDGGSGLCLEGYILDNIGQRIAFFSPEYFSGCSLLANVVKHRIVLKIKMPFLAVGDYVISICTAERLVKVDHEIESALEFRITFCNPGQLSWNFQNDLQKGHIALESEQIYL
jgi:lipopolysaccharide transport system ATP-binding protein